MTEGSVPFQPSHGPDAPRGKPPVHPATSEACRLLCAGVHLHDGFREAVIDQLYVQEQRVAAPSTGFDAARVLAHAVRARRTELWWAAGTVAAWVLGVVLSRGFLAGLLWPAVLLGVAPLVRGTARNAPFHRTFPALVMRWYGRFLMALVAVSGLALGVVGLFTGDDEPDDSSDYGYDSSYEDSFYDSDGVGSTVTDALSPDAVVGAFDNTGSAVGSVWVALLFAALLTALTGLRRGQFARTMAGELSRKQFPRLADDPAERTAGPRLRRLQERIRTEQHASLVMYNEDDPFCGSGDSHHPWNLSVELRPVEGGSAEPLDNAGVLRRIVPLLEDLRVPAGHGSPEAAAAVRDRLRELRVDECVFLPVRGLRHRDDAPYGAAQFEAHRAAAVEEGGESRRHFLRVRVGGWGEEVVVTVFVRVHTQGGMLMLEVAPHVLMPLLGFFHDAERAAERHRDNSRMGKVYWALVHMPGSLVGSLVTLGAGASLWRRRLTDGDSRALPEGPACSVRELAADEEATLFQDMDINRYLKSIQDRVAGGVRLALREAGYRTDEFEQKIVNIGAGGVFIESAKDSAIGIGDHNDIRRTGTPGPVPPKDSGPKSGPSRSGGPRVPRPGTGPGRPADAGPAGPSGS